MISSELPINALFANPHLKLVSFDLFDTLIQRVTGKPEDVFALLEPAVSRLTGHTFTNYQEVRPQAAWLAKLKRQRPREETTLAEIYEQMLDMALLTPLQAETVLGWEIETEKRLLLRREQGLRLFMAAREAGLRVCITTDTYFQKPILKGILKGLAIEGYHDIYASSEYREQKYYGGLFEILLAKEKLSAAEVLHIGDNQHSDVDIPSRLGLGVLHLPAASFAFKNHPANISAYAKGFPDSAVPVASAYASASMGLAAAKIYADSEKKPAPQAQWGGLFEIGYGAVGPAVAAFALWLGKAARNDGRKTLFFLSRDGWLPKVIFDCLAAKLYPEIKSYYIYNSRRVSLTAGIRKTSDIIGICCSYFQAAPLAEWLKDKFCLPPQCLSKNILSKYDIRPDTIIDMTRRKTLIPLCLDLAPAIYELAAENRAALKAYLRENDCIGGAEQAVVDIGFSGAIQNVLAALAEKPGLGGFYFFSDVRISRPVGAGLAAHTFFQGFTDKFSDQFAHKYVFHYFETFFKKPGEGGLEKLEIAPNGFSRPVFKMFDAPANETLIEIQRGAEQFARDLAKHFGPHLADMSINPYSACLPYLNFFLRPAPNDAALLTGFMVDDTFCGNQGSYFLSPAQGPEKITQSYWKEGAEAALLCEP